MTRDDGPGITLDPPAHSLDDGTNARQPGRQPGVMGITDLSSAPHDMPPGNPGEDLGLRVVYLTDYENPGWFATKEVHVIRAIPGTWLSAATKKFGWDAAYGAEDGYGAYKKGIVLRLINHSTDWKNYFGEQADHIKPGQLFAIKIYRPDETVSGQPRQNTEAPPRDAAILDVDPITVDLATKLGVGLDVAAGLTDVVDAFATVPTVFGLLGPIGAIWGSVSAAASIGRGAIEDLASVRAVCYAATSWVWQDRRGLDPISEAISRAFSEFLKERATEKTRRIKRYWRESWEATTESLDELFSKRYKKIYQELVKEKKDVSKVSRAALRNVITSVNKKEYGTSAVYCDKLMEEAAAPLSDKIPPSLKPYWTAGRKTKYPR